jgi:hypothetical protein
MRRHAPLVVCALLALVTSARVSVWSNETRLWVEAVAQSPRKPRPWINLGAALERRGATAAAEDAYRRGLWAAQSPLRSLDEQLHGVRIASMNLDRLTRDWDAWIRGF